MCNKLKYYELFIKLAKYIADKFSLSLGAWVLSGNQITYNFKSLESKENVSEIYLDTIHQRWSTEFEGYLIAPVFTIFDVEKCLENNEIAYERICKEALDIFLDLMDEHDIKSLYMYKYSETKKRVYRDYRDISEIESITTIEELDIKLTLLGY